MDKEFMKIVEEEKCHENKIVNALLAFLSGGIIGLISQMIYVYLNGTLGYSNSSAFTMIFIIWVTISSILTGLGVFDKIASYFKAGIIVPSTGFAHAMTSSAMDNNKEGFITGVGANIFKLTGSIILYGIVSAIIFAFIKGVML